MTLARSALRSSKRRRICYLSSSTAGSSCCGGWSCSMLCRWPTLWMLSIGGCPRARALSPARLLASLAATERASLRWHASPSAARAFLQEEAAAWWSADFLVLTDVIQSSCSLRLALAVSALFIFFGIEREKKESQSNNKQRRNGEPMSFFLFSHV
jgi:hypothetical protein